MAHFTVLGAAGYVGSNLVRHLKQHGHNCQAVTRGQPLPDKLGHLVYCIGLTSDFRNRPFETMDAHVSALAPVLNRGNFDSLTYLSSTRVYRRVNAAIAYETASIPVDPSDPEEIYALSKLAGESVCLSVNNPNVRVVRLSNVYGAEDQSGNFLTTIIHQMLTAGRATFFISLSSEKDYIDIADVARGLELIPLQGKDRIYNLASGQNVTTGEIGELVEKHLGKKVDLRPGAPEVSFPPISIERLRRDTGIEPASLRDRFADLVAGMRQSREIPA